VVAGGSYQNKPFSGVDTSYDGVVSAIHRLRLASKLWRA
jgi:hypothetical protein